MELEHPNPMHAATPAVLIAAAAWLAVYVAARVALQYLRAESFEAVALSITPLFAFFAFVWVVQRAVRQPTSCSGSSSCTRSRSRSPPPSAC